MDRPAAAEALEIDVNQQEFRRKDGHGVLSNILSRPDGRNRLHRFQLPGTDVRIEKGTHLSGYKDPRMSPLKATFFCIPGTPVQILGVHNIGNLKTNPTARLKVLNDYEVLVPIPHALESVCADGIDVWSEQRGNHPVAGGGWQYKVPRPARHVRYTTPFPKR